MAAGLSNFTDTGVLNVFGTPATAGALFDPGMPRIERLRTLARVGLADVEILLRQVGLEDAPLMLGVASDLTADEKTALMHEVQHSPVHRSGASWFPYGRASALLALANAAELIRHGTHRFVVIGGIDSLCAHATVQTLVGNERVLGPHTEGTIPGEGAVFALLARSDDDLELPVSVLVDAAAQGRGTPFMRLDRIDGDALTSVFRALREGGATRVDRVIAAHSGEGYFGRSFTHAYLREVEMMPEPLVVDVIADWVGDVGAAAGTLGMAFAMYRLATGQTAAGRALVYSESDGGEVAATIVHGAPRSWQRRVA